MNKLMIFSVAVSMIVTTSIYLFANNGDKPILSPNHLDKEKMKVEIWSNMICSWCYLGKHRLENALERFEHSEEVEVVFKSYQLDPNMVTKPDLTISEYLPQGKGVSLEQAEGMNIRMEQLAVEAGLEYNLDNIIPLNTKQPHGFLHFANSKGKQVEMKERLMKAYFIKNLNRDDQNLQTKLAQELGLNKQDVETTLNNKIYVVDVQQDAR